MKKILTYIVITIMLILFGVQSIQNYRIYFKIKEFQSPDYSLIKKATVEIKIGKSGGSGVIIENNKDKKHLYILTAKHIVLEKGKIIILIHDKNNKRYFIKNISRDNVFKHKKLDLALIKVIAPKGDFEKLKLKNQNPEIGKIVYTIGHPVNMHYTLNRGIVSNYTHKKFLGIEGEYLLISAPSFNGNSGGAVINYENKLIGIVVGIVYVPINKSGSQRIFLPHMTFAVKISDIKDFIEEVK